MSTIVELCEQQHSTTGFRRSAERVYKIKASAVLTRTQVFNALFLYDGVAPGRFWSFGGDIDTGLILVDLQASMENGNPYRWRVVARYDTDYLDAISDFDRLPWERLPTVSWATRFVDEYLEEDLDGNAIVNSAGVPFDPPVTKKRKRIVMSVERNELYFYHEAIRDFVETLNEAAFYGFEAEQCYMEDIRAVEANEQGSDYYRVSYTIIIDQKQIVTNEGQPDEERRNIGWKTRLLNIGLMELSGGALRPILDNAGRPSASPRLLDADGLAYLPSETPIPTYEEFSIIPPADWDPLGLPYPGGYTPP